MVVKMAKNTYSMDSRLIRSKEVHMTQDSSDDRWEMFTSSFKSLSKGKADYAEHVQPKIVQRVKLVLFAFKIAGLLSFPNWVIPFKRVSSLRSWAESSINEVWFPHQEPGRASSDWHESGSGHGAFAFKRRLRVLWRSRWDSFWKRRSLGVFFKELFGNILVFWQGESTVWELSYCPTNYNKSSGFVALLSWDLSTNALVASQLDLVSACRPRWFLFSLELSRLRMNSGVVLLSIRCLKDSCTLYPVLADVSK